VQPWNSLYRVWLDLSRRLLFLWVRSRVPPDQRERLEGLPDSPTCYVLERPGLAEAAVLDQELIRSGRTPASRGIAQPGLTERRAVVYLRGSGRRFLRRNRPPDLSRMSRVLSAVGSGAVEDVTIVPVAVYWGRAPGKEGSALKLLFSEDWAIVGRLRRFFTILFHGRDVLVLFSAPISVRSFLAGAAPDGRSLRKIARVLRVHLRRQRVATIGPDLSHRRTLIDEVLRGRAVRSAVRREVDVNRVPERKAEARARAYALEIAADFSPPFIRFMERVLKRLWTRLYEGVEIGHLGPLRDAAADSAIVYVPCHRSHIDYLLLSYVVYTRGLTPPHIAAGLNLNLPIVGRFLRRGGAFFLRRSFRENPLYAAVFNKYLSLLLARGVPIEYFVEGGRSRTGRLLAARPGMLSMTVRSYLRDPHRSLVFVPVYFGYERLIEGKSYISELAGQPKKRETLLGLIKSLKVLRQRFGKVYVNFGTPIDLPALLDEYQPDWRERDYRTEERPAWLQSMVRDLGQKILTGINEAAAVNPVNLVATALLSTPRCSMLETDLVQSLDTHLALLETAPYSERVTRPSMTGRQILDYTEQLGLLKRRAHKLGDIMFLQERDAILASYFRNNVSHLMALPSLIACCFMDTGELPAERLYELLRRIYPYVQQELHVRWPPEEMPAAADRVVEALVARGLLLRDGTGSILRRPEVNSQQAIQLSFLGRNALNALERYYVTVALLLKHGPGVLTQSRLEELCQLMAQRISFLYQLDAPEFFDRRLFRGFIAGLKQHGVIELDEHGHIRFGDALAKADEDARAVLGEHFRHDILQAVHV
jgi:glycerol-3-phosphate O-acyltransferase